MSSMELLGRVDDGVAAIATPLRARGAGMTKAMARLFVAVDVDAALRGALSAAVARVPMQRVRLVPPAQLHLTLRFLGDVDEAGEHALLSSLPAIGLARSPFSVMVAGAGTFGGPGAPRVIWAGLRDPRPRCLPTSGGPPGEIDRPARLLRLASDVDEVATAAGLGASSRPFRPHLTLGRGKMGARVDGDALRAIGEIGLLRVNELVLYRSELSSQGARHTPRARVALTGSSEPNDAREG